MPTVQVTSRRSSWHILLLLLFQACSPQLSKGPIGPPDPSEERFQSYPYPGAVTSLANCSKPELVIRLHTVLKKLKYSPVAPIDLDQGFEIKSGFHSQGDHLLTKNMFVQIALILKVKEPEVPTLDLRYGVAWARRKEPKWRYDQFPPNLVIYIEKFFDKLYEEIDATMIDCRKTGDPSQHHSR